MGILDHLWDDTFAGPLPETGLSKLRKSSTFSFRGKESDGGSKRSDGGDSSDDVMKVSRSIMIVKAYGNPSSGNGSPPSSPSGSTSPVSPFSAETSTSPRPPPTPPPSPPPTLPNQSTTRGRCGPGARMVDLK